MPENEPIMMVRVKLAEGGYEEVLFEGPRFKHKDFGKVTPDFISMNGWSILGALAPIILFHRPYCVVELGAGESTFILAKAAYDTGVKMYTCDKRPDKKSEYFTDHVYYNMLTEDFMAAFDDTPALVLIDADHSYEMSKREFEFFYQKLIPGGVIFLHDTFPPAELYLRPTACHDVYRLRHELETRQAELDCDVFTWPYSALHMGLTMVIKRDPDRPYFGK